MALDDPMFIYISISASNMFINTGISAFDKAFRVLIAISKIC